MTCEVISDRGDDPVAYRATEMSTEGIWLATSSPLRSGATVVVCFAPDDGIARELMLFAAVARVSTARGATDDTPGVGMGLELLDATGEEEQRLARWLASRRSPVPRRRRPIAERLVEPAAPARLAGCWR